MRKELQISLLSLLVSMLISYSQAITCSGGFYDSAGTCYRCPRGYYCTGSQTPIKCKVGYYSDYGASSCDPCPAGFKCPTPNAIPIPCLYGQYAEAGSSECTACPPGYYCDTPASILECPRNAGDKNYCLGGTATKRKCPAGYFCPTTEDAPIACGVGTYSAAGSDVCTPCEPGKFCPTTAAPSYDCPTGTYSIGKATACTPCPADHSCASVSVLPIACGKGQYSPEYDTVCHDCPEGYYCDRATPGKPIKCGAGKYSAAKATQCITCQPGYECYDGKAHACAAGWYSTGGTNICKICPAGSSCSSTNSDPVPCNDGYHASFGKTSCKACGAGYFCPSKTMDNELACPKKTYQSFTAQTFCIPCVGHDGCDAVATKLPPTYCSDGQYYNGLLNCIDCPAGYYCPDPRSSKVLPCDVGYYAPAKSVKCSICPPGYYCADGSTATACADGYYSAYGALRCSKCPPGYMCNTGLKTVIGVIKCPPGYTASTTACTICPVGKMCPFSEFDPIDCPAGTTAPIEGMTKCQPCPHGSACTASASPAACADGKYAHLYEGTCVDCPKNHACKNGIKFECPLNYYSGAKATECLPCPAGKTCMLQDTPTACAAGEYSTTTTFLCRKCPPGYKCPDGATITPCAAGTYAKEEGMTDCTTCPAGTYSPQTSAMCYTCPGGHDCSSKTTYTKCPVGTYSLPGTGVCQNGISGFIYPPYAEVQFDPLYIAPKGTYSKQEASGQVALYKCPAGKYSSKLGATADTDCIVCPAGFYCPEGTGDPNLFVCPQGYFCLAGSVTPTACPADTYSYVRGSSSANTCRPCSAGYACAGASGVPEACPMGYYCPYGAKMMCPAGYYSGYRSGLRTMDECVVCPAGFYCPEGAPDPIPAPLGYYNPWMGMSELGSMLKCPPSYPCTTTGLSMFKGPPCKLGYYCPAGTKAVDEFPCPAGTYSNSHYAVSEYDCLPCPRGYACAEHTTQSTLVACSPGHYCPRGTKTPTEFDCPAGTFRTDPGARRIEDCVPCPHGKFCVAGKDIPEVCPAGYYCPLGTKFGTQYPCRPGTYSPATTTGLESQEGCKQCEFGKYCDGKTPTTPKDCNAGEYNNFSKEASECLKCPAGYKCGVGAIDPVACTPGFYSDKGASDCAQCEIGYYCPEPGTSKETKETLLKCYAGMFCSSSGFGLAVYPDLDTHGCSTGKYCPAGTDEEKNCPAGTYNRVRGRGSITDCLTTPAGYYTDEGATDYVLNECDAGYFCLAGSPTKTQYACPPGTYRGFKAAAKPEECVTCPAGSYCLTATAIPKDCPEGFYCPLGTSRPESCPEGTYSNSKKLFDSKSCKPCPAGKFCYQRNLTNPVDLCDPGFYCIQGSKRPEPTDKITGNLCPKGGYCGLGAAVPAPCNAGRLMLISGAYEEAQCVPCPPGYYCVGSNSPDPTGTCDPGYFCGASTSVRNPPAGIAPIGTYAPAGSQFALKCPRGTYQDQTGRSTCAECDPGYKCTEVGLTTKPTCPYGYYCPSLTWFSTRLLTYDALACPVGTYNNLEGRASENDCSDCTTGKYCPVQGAKDPAGDCAAGYFCLTKSPYEKPPIDDPGKKYGICPTGKYCGTGTGTPANCKVGTYSNAEMLTLDTQCLTCYEGKYCATAGITAPTDDCSAGYYCPEGQTAPNPVAYQCTSPKYCPPGSGSPIECPPGFYNDENVKGNCKDCPKGSYCYAGTVRDCPAGFYCP